MKKKISAEQLSYEFSEIWEDELFKEIEFKRILDTLKKVPHDISSLCDIGCGNGLFLDAVRDSFVDKIELCGVERSLNAISRVNHKVIESDIAQIKIDDRSFDCVTALEVIEHFTYDDYTDCMREIARISAKYILITVPSNQNLRNYQMECPQCACHFNPDYHMRSFSKKDLSNLFSSHGFICEKVFSLGSVLVFRRGVELIYKAIRAARRVYKNRDIFPKWTICPNCRYVKKDVDLPLSGKKNIYEDDGVGSADKNQISSFKNMIISSSLLNKKRERWIGAIYKKIC